MQFLDAHTAAGSRTAALTDLLHGARTIVNHSIEIALRGRVTDADQHADYL
ncbi:MAG TPA: hypothetical protein VHN14_26350 [Kofleriaceae bacterium]|nr:hypothetical protein [Kofleriaceae bacterium]